MPNRALQLGQLLQKLGNFERAAEAYEAALAHNSNFAKAHWNLSICRLLQGDFRARLG